MSAAAYLLMLSTQNNGTGEIDRRSIPETTFFEYCERRATTTPIRPEQSEKVAEFVNRLLYSNWIKEYADWRWKIQDQRRGGRRGGADGA